MALDQHFVTGQPIKTDYPREVCEHMLAHKLSSEVEATYLRGLILKSVKV